MRQKDETAPRIAALRAHLGLTRDLFAEPLGVPGTRIQDIERGKQKATVEVLAAIQDVYKPNPQWLLKGIGEMFTETQISEPMPGDEWVTLATGRTRARTGHSKSKEDFKGKLEKAYASVTEALNAVDFVPSLLQREALRTVAFNDGVPVDRLILLIEAMRDTSNHK